ncbi:MAG: IPT/TIG domain-containing protein, partial [Actinomycetota bacterium]
SGTLVEIGGTTFTPSSITKTHLSVAIPASFLTTAAIHNVDIFNPGPGGGKSGNKEFMVANPSPTLNSLSYSLASVVAGKGDFALTISGKDFMSGATVDIGNSTGLTPLSITSSKVTVVVPAAEVANAGQVSVRVHNPPPGGGTSEFLSFMVNSEPSDGIWAQAPWQTVVNAGTVMPNSTRKFNSYTQPAVNRRGLVAFRAHSKGTDSSGGEGGGGGEGETAAAAPPTEQGEPVRGIYKVDMNQGMPRPVEEIATGAMEVPWPNNTTYQDGLASFNEFPSVSRIAIDFDTVAFRGQSQPVWTYTDPASGTESRAGSGGIYVSLHPNGDPLHDGLRTGIGLLGAIPLPDPYDPLKDFSYMQVPGAAVTPTKFDQFPGSPALADQFTIAFKGNYTEGDTGRTGVFFRDIFGQEGRAPVQLVANSTMIIPNQPEGGTVVFGSTAPPSTADGYMVFAGYDNEDAPTLGGIYRAPLIASPPVGTNPLLESLVSIGETVPGESATFNKLSEGLSFDGRYVGFWGAWGAETKPLLLICATDGNKDMIANCNEMYPSGFETTVPLHQGIFVYDTESKQITTIAKTGDNFDDFVYWVFSGRPPGAHGGAGEDLVPEPPRWRSSSFVAVSGQGQMHLRVAFKGKIGSVDGIYLHQAGDPSETQVLLDTTLPGQNLDPLAPAGATISSVGIERDGFRGDWLVLTTGMLDPVTSESWSGIYAAHIPQP